MPKKADLQKAKHLPVLDYLRGVAALSVCLFHFSSGNPGFLPSEDPIKKIGSYGWLGVEAFFVISGFVIPLSLFQRSYRMSDCLSFFIRRLKRLEPPYLACILLVILLHYASSLIPGFRGERLVIDWIQLGAHLGYLNSIFNYGWFNPVFWTLAIEFQYYFLIAIAFPLFVSKKWIARYISVLLLGCLGFLGFGNSALLPFWLPLFSIGIAAFQVYTKQIPWIWFCFLMLIICPMSLFLIGVAQTAVGLLTALAILFVGDIQLPRVSGFLKFYGKISYSLYLLHCPIGGRVINLAVRFSDSILYRYPAILIAFAVSTLAAYLFWRFVELPSQVWSKNSLFRSEKESNGDPVSNVAAG